MRKKRKNLEILDLAAGIYLLYRCGVLDKLLEIVKAVEEIKKDAEKEEVKEV